MPLVLNFWTLQIAGIILKFKQVSLTARETAPNDVEGMTIRADPATVLAPRL